MAIVKYGYFIQKTVLLLNKISKRTFDTVSLYPNIIKLNIDHFREIVTILFMTSINIIIILAVNVGD